HPRPTLFPYTTLFRSGGHQGARRGRAAGRRTGVGLVSARRPTHARPTSTRAAAWRLILGTERKRRHASNRKPWVDLPAERVARRSEEHTSELQSRENL